jgi:hypothetical protein
VAQSGAQQPDPQPFALVDANRVVIILGGQYQINEKIQKGVLARGIDIEISGLIVGKVLDTGQMPVRITLKQKYIDSDWRLP